MVLAVLDDVFQKSWTT